uniref:phosphatidylinositol 4-phosphate 3-kinase C2 domain-containing subunit beta-like isoform X3 n=1 Tax=Pristiophorus japonicus TaxID=55135 RepID=UPI00398E3759
MELPVDGSFPDHQQCPAPDPSVQAPYGWQESCMELEMGTATNDLQRMPSAVHYQGPTPPVNPMSPMPNYPQPCSTYPQTFPDCQLHYNEQVMASPRVESWQPNLLNQETWPSFAVQNACYANPPEESPRDRYLAFLQESVPVQTSHNEPVPYPVNPEQMFYPFDSGLKMPTPASTSLGKEHRLMNRGWSSFDESRRPSTTETFQICPNMRLNSVSEWLGAGYQEASSLQFQDVIPRPSHPTFEMDTSKESEHQKPTEPALGHFMQTGMAEVDSNSPHSPLLPVGFEAIGPSNTNLSNPYSSSAPFPEPPFPEPPNICETGTTLHQRSQLLRRTSSTNCCHQLDVWMKPPASDLPISDHVFSLQHSKDNFPATCDPGDSKGVLLPLMVKLVDKPEGNNEEVVALCNMLNMIRAKYPSSMTQSNCGLIRSIVTVFPDELLWVWRFPVTIVTDIFPEPVQTFAYAGSTVEELILRILSDSQQSSEAEDDYVLKLCDAEEVLQNPCTLGSHECLQHYLKLNNDIRLQLLRYSDLQRVLARTVGDDQSQSTLHQSVAIENGACKVSLSRKVLSSKLNSYHHEASSLFSSQKSTGRVVEEVKAICYVLSSVETKEITDAIQQLKSVVLLQTSFHTVQLPNRQGSLAGAINALTAAVSQLVHIYCNNFDTDYQAANVSAKETASVTQAQLNTTRFSFTIYAVHGIPSAWTRSYENLFVSCSLNYGDKELCQSVKTEQISITKSSLFLLARWNQRVYMPIEIRQLPCEVTLNLALHGYRTTTGNHTDANRHCKNAELLASASMPLYSSKLVLVHNTKLLCLVPANSSQADSCILQIDFPDSPLVTFCRPAPAVYSQYFTEMDEVSRKQITNIQQKQSLLLIEEQEKSLLWTNRSFCNSSNCFLPLLLGSAPSWALGSLPEIYAVLRRWSFSAYPLESLGLLLSSFSDQELRQAAVQQIGTILDDELLDYLPQLVQAVKFEWHLNSPLVEFLLDRSLRSIRVAHQLYWLLKDCLADSQFKGRFSQLLAAVLCGSGQAMREEFDKETKLIDRLAEVAGKVCAADQSKRSTVLTKAIEEVEKFFYQEHVCRLPLNPVFAVKGIDPSACSYFTSNAVPLKISFINADPLGKNINVIYKSGDDLRQDMLVLQIVKVMDRIWCQEGLHMCMIIYRCTSTGRGRATGRLAGLVEMVPGATTLAKIHMKHGIIGPLKENTLSKWFQEHNPTKESHQNAVENFINSCAGWCVATFILGICDRHNDNIMLKTTGHMFHIDFGKFLGHAQMIGRMKRDRAPFIFTSEMAHFITEGGKNGARFQRFVDLSCLAYNIIRQRTQLLMNLLELMLSAGLPELAEVQDLKYVYNNLRPKDSDAQATSYFTSLINESLKSLLVKMNFVAHNLAQMKLAGQDVQPSLSFAPEKHTIQTDSRISSALVCGYEKKIVPHKEYFYKIQVEREGQSEATFIERSFNQFGELNKQLHCCFPASELPRFPFKPLIGLSKGRELARKRKDELNIYVRYLLNGSPQVAKSDLVYTFFHCFPNNERPCVSPSPDAVSHTGKLSASMQLCISWENSKLSVMVKHVKNILEYVGISSTELPNRVIQLSVWCRQSLLGAVNIPLRNVIMEEEKWYRLGNSLV